MEFKKFGKIFAAISMAAVMSVSALSASAISITNGSGDSSYGGFYANYYGTFDPEDEDAVYSTDYHPAPHGMYDGNIVSAVKNSNGTITLTLRAYTFNVGSTTATSSIYAITNEAYDNEEDIVDGNLIQTDEDNVQTVTLSTDTIYYLYVNGYHYARAIKLNTSAVETSLTVYPETDE